MNLKNTVSAQVKTLEDLIPLSPFAETAITVVRKHMKFDAGHDEAHLVRVARLALWFGSEHKAHGITYKSDPDVLIPAAILHDLVNLPKSHPDRSSASRRSAKKAIEEMEKIQKFKSDMHHVSIRHAIEAHSFSAKIKPISLEAMAVQDADRIESLGHIGLARLFSVGGALKRALWHPTDPLAVNRELDELAYTMDHIAVKLGTLYSSMTTEIGNQLAFERTGDIIMFIVDLMKEIGGFDTQEEAHEAHYEDIRRFVFRSELVAM